MEVRDDTIWKGVHLSELQTSLNRYQHPRLVPNAQHTILIKTPVAAERVPECFPSIFDKRDYWDQNHVKLPCSEKNITKEQISRWRVMRDVFSTAALSSSRELEAAIFSYNKRYSEQWNFSALHSFFEEVFDEAETEMFFTSLLPRIVELALRLPELVTGGIPLLKRGHKHSVTLSQLQISCLLANAFLCTFPHRNSTKKNSEYFDYPDINFNRLFCSKDSSRMKSIHEKLKCILNYFRRVTTTVPKGVVTYSRQFVPCNLFPDWSRSNNKLPRLYVSSAGTIEDDGFGLFQVDFADKFVGGGVLGRGCVQEEIRFVICPELILSRLFTQCLGENEALVVTGCERFNKYKGYGSTFEWDGDYVDGTPLDEDGRKYCTVIAVDALYYKRNPAEQYLPENVSRDMNKAYVGFSWGSRRRKDERCAVASGNWGCGVFRGDPQLKSLLQLMAAAEVGRDFAYFTFGDVQLRDSMASIHEFLFEKDVTVGRIHQLLGKYNAERMFTSVRLFDYLRKEINGDGGNAAATTDEKEGDSFSLKAPNTFVSTTRIASTASATPKLAITQRAFCYRMKTADSPKVECESSEKRVTAENDRIDSLDSENDLKLGELRALSKFYRPSNDVDGSGGCRVADSSEVAKKKSKTPDVFDFFDRFTSSLRSKKKSNEAAAVAVRANAPSVLATSNHASVGGDDSGRRSSNVVDGTAGHSHSTFFRDLADTTEQSDLSNMAPSACTRRCDGKNEKQDDVVAALSCDKSAVRMVDDKLSTAEHGRLQSTELVKNCDADERDTEKENAASKEDVLDGVETKPVGSSSSDCRYLPVGRLNNASSATTNATKNCSFGGIENSISRIKFAGRHSTGRNSPSYQKRKISDYFSPRNKKPYNESSLPS